MKVLKFGGTSVSSKESISAICRIVKQQISNSPIVVVSALKGITNLLLSLPKLNTKEQNIILKKIQESHLNISNQVCGNNPDHREYIQNTVSIINKLLIKTKNFTPNKIDRLVSYGEIMSSFIITHALKQKNINSKQILATELIVTDDNFGAAEWLIRPTEKRVNNILNPLLEKKIVPVITGFIGTTKNGKITTLGRGSSDYSASIIGYCVKASEIQIWTDVDGVLTADPKLIKESKTLRKISYDTADAFAISGANVLFSKMIKPVIKQKIPIRILNTFNTSCKGTLIVDEMMSKTNKSSFLGVTIMESTNTMCEISLIGENLHLPVLLEKLVSLLHIYKDRINIRQQNNYRLCFLVDSKNSDHVAKLLYKEFIK